MTCQFHVVDTKGQVILGLPTCEELNLVLLNYSLGQSSKDKTEPSENAKLKGHILSKYPNLFQGIGCFEGEYHITLNPAIPPVIHPPRRVPEALREPLKQELDSLCQQGIILLV